MRISQMHVCVHVHGMKRELFAFNFSQKYTVGSSNDWMSWCNLQLDLFSISFMYRNKYIELTINWDSSLPRIHTLCFPWTTIQSESPNYLMSIHIKLRPWALRNRQQFTFFGSQKSIWKSNFFRFSQSTNNTKWIPCMHPPRERIGII